RRSARCDPMNPATPVTMQRMGAPTPGRRAQHSRAAAAVVPASARDGRGPRVRECGASQGKVRVQKKAARAALAVAVSGALVALVIAQLDLAEATARFRAARPGWLAAAALASFSVLLLRGARFTTLGRHAGFGLTTAATAIQNF